MIAAVVDSSTGNVTNVIVVDSLNDPIANGSILVAVPDGAAIGPGQATWSPTGGFTIIPPVIVPQISVASSVANQ